MDYENNNNINDTAEEASATMPELIYDIVETLAITTAIIFLIFTFIVRVAIVDGDSMEKTLSNADVLLISDLAFEPEYGDIVVFQQIHGYYGDKPLVKRVIATEGQTIDIDFFTWTVTVDGVEIDEEAYRYLDTSKKVLSDYEYPLTIPENHVFVMGDNRNGSSDSRDDRVGVVDERFISGRVLFRVFPLTEISYFGKLPE